MKQFLYPLSAESATSAIVCGPKAANQAALGRAGLPIPAGFCLNADAYRHQLDSLGLAEHIDASTALEESIARQKIADIRIALYEGPIAPKILDPLKRAWESLVGQTESTAVVRSSALVEDRGGSNFAGQFQSFLGVDSYADFLVTIRACWAALWAPRVLRYMRTYGYHPADTAMALILQPLINATSSGGALSRSAAGTMIINSTWGLGPSIAQGEVVPDRIELSRSGKLLRYTIGRKSHSIGCHLHGEPVAKGVEDRVSLEPSLTRSQAVELAQMLPRTEEIVGGPAEIEWALNSSGFKLLQVRPLTVEPVRAPDEIWSKHPNLNGHPGGVGWATGRACVINCECELSRLAPGDVLVTSVAGPALSQILPKVSGLVAELGGSTSHIASLARERGIPMVLGVQEATKRIPDGKQVAVDGVAGVVRWIS